ncbi:recombinase family protein [Peptoniphilus indolicus]|uniref:Transposon Tn552 DNA-invertase bin3 n=1 Tax=Peptoniphilus indolicus TaxID=33030 RepID=A0A379DC91_9FIRM|nr:recombinase family protein [Peptoniphilus indolicus]SUB75618.1 Putative transposon Tn552 DNA-invertase bin3 [Peptoniphilus indolicus]SUB94785.1 Putative transposon Tn552 DNA-invertase bin3 [Peptoniphilus indolicus]
MKYGYVRVSTKEQNVDRQMSAILEEGIEINKIYIDKASGKDFNRKKYKRLIKRIKEGDELYIKSIDRLGRNYDEIIKEWNKITKEKNADIIVLDFPLLDTRAKVNDLTGKFIADIVLQILSYVAQIERENIHQRQMEGIREAKKRGVKFGRVKKEIPKEFYNLAEKWSRNEISLRKGAKVLGVSHTTFSNWVKEKGYYLREV